MQIEYAQVSLTGDRHENQDRAEIVVKEDAVLMLVFDGMGGHADGARAAEIGLKTIREMFSSAELPLFDPQGFLYTALARAHDAVVGIGDDLSIDFRPRATGAVCLVQEGGSFWAHVGDSRIYHVRDGRVICRSRDHSHVEVLIQEGAITEEEAVDHPMRNFVECCIGGDAAVPDMSISGKKWLQPGDILLACTDGLWSGMRDTEIAHLASLPGVSLADTLQALGATALAANSPHGDNTTGTIMRWNGE